MAHFAKLNENNNVLAVHVVNNDVITINGVESEQVGIDFLTGLHGHTLWKQTSYNANTRGKYAGIGDSYNAEENIFVTPKPYPSWIRSGSLWNAPTPMPTDDKIYSWNESKLKWEEVNA